MQLSVRGGGAGQWRQEDPDVKMGSECKSLAVQLLKAIAQLPGAHDLEEVAGVVNEVYEETMIDGAAGSLKADGVGCRGSHREQQQPAAERAKRAHQLLKNSVFNKRQLIFSSAAAHHWHATAAAGNSHAQAAAGAASKACNLAHRMRHYRYLCPFSGYAVWDTLSHVWASVALRADE